jgi:beta-galactosidase
LDTFTIGSTSGVCAVNRQSYLTESATPVGWYDDGSVAVVEHQYGKGRLLLIGTAAGAAYHRSNGTQNGDVFSWLLDWLRLTPRAQVNAPNITARMHIDDEDMKWLWVLNPTAYEQTVTIDLSDAWGDIATPSIAWGNHDTHLQDRRLRITIGGKDAVIARLS